MSHELSAIWESTVHQNPYRSPLVSGTNRNNWSTPLSLRRALLYIKLFSYFPMALWCQGAPLEHHQSLSLLCPALRKHTLSFSCTNDALQNCHPHSNIGGASVCFLCGFERPAPFLSCRGLLVHEAAKDQPLPALLTKQFDCGAGDVGGCPPLNYTLF